jgi:hypothetical protein
MTHDQDEFTLFEKVWGSIAILLMSLGVGLASIFASALVVSL